MSREAEGDADERTKRRLEEVAAELLELDEEADALCAVAIVP